MNILDVKVSCFKNYKDIIPKDVNLIKFLTSPKYNYVVEKIRNTKTKREIDALKSTLPAITPSGQFHPFRKAKNLTNHSGLIQIDIDGKDNLSINLKQTKELLMDIQAVCFCAYSVSGNGLFALIPIADVNQHKQHYLALEEDFKNDFNIVIDKSCKDVSRLRGYSYDPNYYINDKAIIYDKVIDFETKVTTQLKKVRIEPLNESDTFYQALKIITYYQMDITGSNEQWFSILCAVACEFGESGRGYAHIISQYSQLYDSNRLDIDYDRALKSNYRYGIGTFYYYFKQQVV